MFQHVVRWTFFITIWKKYKGQLLTTFAYLLGLLLVSLVHQDYLDYVAVSNEGQGFVSSSFLIKRVTYVSVTGASFWIFSRFSKSAQWKHEDLGFLKKFSSSRKRSAVKKDQEQQPLRDAAATNNADNANPTQPDPFANIRKKQKLRSEADLIIEKNKR